MGYLSFLEKTTSNKIVLVELDLGKNQTKWVNYSAGVWTAKWTPSRTIINIGDGNIGDYPIGMGEYKNYLSIGSVFGGATEYTEKSSIADVVSNQESWYYDNTDMRLYIHCTDNDEPQLHSITVGITMGLANKAIYFNDLYYEPRLTSIPTIEKSKDPLYFGVIRFDSGSISFINNDGYFDDITSNYLFGQPARILFGGDDLDYSEYQKVFSGYIEDVDLGYETVTFRLVDERKKLSLKLPVNQFNKTDYPYLDDDDVGKAIPIAYGEVYHCPVICTNKAQSGTPDWTFKVCDTSDHSNGIQSIDKIYVDGVEKTIKSSSLANGTVTIDNADWDGKSKVTVDFKGLKNSSGTYITNPLDIIVDILDTYLGIEYNDDNYNTTEWAEAKAHDLANDIGIFIDEEMAITEIIEKIGNSVFGNFIVQNNGKYTFRILDTSQDPEMTIHIEQMLEPPQISWDGTQFLTSCKVGYKKNYSEDSYRWYTNDTDKDKIYAKYKKYISKEFETYLVNEADAQELSEAIMEYYQDVKPIYTVTTSIQAIGSEIESIESFEINRVGKSWLDYVKVEIIGVVKDFLNNTVQLIGRHIAGLTVFFFFRVSPFAININEYAINIDEYALSYGRGKWGVREK